MISAAKLGGVIPILPTPFTARDEIDCEAVGALIDFAVACGVKAVGTPAYASEFYKLDASERALLVETALAAARGRVGVVAQCNHHSPRHAARLAAEAETRGAVAINVALPRAFGSSPNQLLNFAQTVCEAVSLPVIVQDWNPAGGSVGVDFALELRRRCRNFDYLKLEDAGIAPLIRTIHRETGGEVQVFSGWGGTFMLEHQPAGACGIMSGLGVADVLVRVWRSLEEGKADEAFALFPRVLPYLQFSLQSLEMHHHVDKQLLVSRGVLRHAFVRPVTIDVSDDARAHLAQLIGELRPLLASAGAYAIRADQP